MTDTATPARRLLTLTIFPLLLGGSMVVASAGLARELPSVPLSLGLVACVALTIALLERLHPHSARWQEPREDVVTDWTHLVITMVVGSELTKAAVRILLIPVAASISEGLGFELWPARWPLLAQATLALFVAEILYYAYHRAAHETELLWRLHATHHSAERLYWLNANRFHPIEASISYVVEIGPLILLGASEQVLALFAVFTAVHGMLQHANIRMELGPLNWVFSGTELHRWHHSRDVSSANHNYGSNLIWMDLLLGTRFLPGDREHQPEDVGIEMEGFPKTYLGQLLSPFRWSQLQAHPLEAPEVS